MYNRHIVYCISKNWACVVFRVQVDWKEQGVERTDNFFFLGGGIFKYKMWGFCTSLLQKSVWTCKCMGLKILQRGLKFPNPPLVNLHPSCVYSRVRRIPSKAPNIQCLVVLASSDTNSTDTSVLQSSVLIWNKIYTTRIATREILKLHDDDDDIVVVEGSLVSSMRETGPEGHYTVSH